MELIGKQIAIETILGQPPELHYPSWYAAQIEKLPPAPPEYLAEQAGILVTDDDTISRAKAIDALVAETIYTEEELKEYYEANSHRNEWVNGIYEAVEVIKQLPPAQPDVPDINVGDMISRAKAIEAVNSLTYPSSLVDVKRKLVDLPPAQPERIKSKWIPIGMADAVGGESAMWGDKIAYHVCEKCWKQALERDGEEVLSDFCPNCGADMRGEQE